MEYQLRLSPRERDILLRKMGDGAIEPASLEEEALVVRKLDDAEKVLTGGKDRPPPPANQQYVCRVIRELYVFAPNATQAKHLANLVEPSLWRETGEVLLVEEETKTTPATPA